MEEPLKRLFKRHFGEPVDNISNLASDGSNRKYFRLISAKRSIVGVFGPDYRENAAFLGFSRHFRKIGLPAPEIYAEDLANSVYLEEDLGDTSLFQFLSQHRASNGFSKNITDIYEQVVRLLPKFQIVAGRTLDYKLCYPRACFDKQSMRWDTNHFKYYFLKLAGIPFNEQTLEDDFERFVDFLLEADSQFFLYRDFQSRNIMIKNGKPYFIDYQGGRQGALQYDIASLLFDAKADIPFKLREMWLKRYLETAWELTPIDRQKFARYYPGFVLIRIMQAMGAYGLRGFYERKSHFLQSIPFAIRNIEYLLRTIELPIKVPELMGVFRRIVGSSYLRQLGKAHLKLTVRVQSFSYKSGIPMDETGHGGGFVFDCRALPNPGKFEQFVKSTGKDADVIDFLDKEAMVKEFLGHVFDLVSQTVKNYQDRNFTELWVAFGCTGGQHRSVYCAELLAQYLRTKHSVDVDVRHRALEKTVLNTGS